MQAEIEKKTSKLVSTKNEVLVKNLKTLTKDFEAVKAENKELKIKLEELTKTCERLENKERRLAIGQVAWLLEKEIWKGVLPDEEPGTVAIFKSMEDWLEENKSNDEGTAAQKRWDDLKLKLNWNDNNHRRALKLLKRLRNDDAHPTDVDLEVARQQLKEGNYVTRWQKKSCTEIIDMIKTARNLNNPK